jgi:hypothetical protein
VWLEEFHVPLGVVLRKPDYCPGTDAIALRMEVERQFPSTPNTSTRQVACEATCPPGLNQLRLLLLLDLMGEISFASFEKTALADFEE